MSDDAPIGVDERDLDDVALETLAEAYAEAPSAGLRDRVLRAAAASPGAAPAAPVATASAVTRWRIVGALAAGAAFVLGGLLTRTTARLGEREQQLSALTARSAALAQKNDGLKAANDDLTARLAEQGKTLVGLREALESQAHVLRILGGPRTMSASLAPKEGFGGVGRVNVDAETGDGAVVLAGVKALPQDKVYELWALRASGPPEPLGLLDTAGHEIYVARVSKLAKPSEVTAFAVSIEPPGGSPSPTGPIVLVGTVAG